MKKKIFEYFDNSIEVNKAVVDGLLDEIIARTTEGAYADGYDEGHDDGRIDGYEDGYADGRTGGYEDGYNNGLEEGYTNGYDSAYQEVAANENLKPENIRKGVDLFGVIGTYEGEPTEEPPEE